jgi:S-layer homology domain
VWAMGEYWCTCGPDYTFTMHWDGAQWRIVPSPNPGNTQNFLYGATALATNDVWAVGDYYSGENVPTATLVEHWDGSSWQIVPSANVEGLGNELDAVWENAPNDIWTVGYTSNPNFIDFELLAEHWDGTQWNVVPLPPQDGGGALAGVAGVGSNDLWAVGLTYSYPEKMLAMHWDGPPCPSPTVTTTPSTGTPTASPTGTPTTQATVQATITHTPTHIGTPTPTNTTTSGPTSTSYPTSTQTSTAMPSTPTPILTQQPATITPTVTSTSEPTSPTPTECTIQFSDVPPGSTFYPYIHCLACLGIISGYPDGTFKPNNQVTRGQLSKIVANSAGFSDNQATQMFQDVPIGSTFFQYIGRLASRGFISGYPCGGPDEPCEPGNLPYFRPNNNATRGQISKIVSNAAEFNDPPTGRQFQDVPAGSTYYTYTYRLITRGVMSGYSCGGQGEPCLPPANLPYFRPNNNATRGQTSKIVANTFFPACNPREGTRP